MVNMSSEDQVESFIYHCDPFQGWIMCGKYGIDLLVHVNYALDNIVYIDSLSDKARERIRLDLETFLYVLGCNERLLVGFNYRLLRMRVATIMKMLG